MMSKCARFAFLFLILSFPSLAELRTAEELEREYQEILRLEADLGQRYARLQREGRDSFAVLQRLREETARLSDEDKQKLVGKKMGASLDPELQARLGPLLDYVREAGAELQDFQRAYDDLNNRKMDYFLSRYDSMLGSVYGEIRESLRPQDRPLLDEIRERMHRQRDTYLSKERAFFGDPRDRQRLVPYIMFFVELDNLMRTAHRLTLDPDDRRRLETRGLFARIRDGVSLALALPRVALSLYRNNGIVDAIAPHIERRAAANGLRYEVRGAENRPPPSDDPDRLTIYVPLHAHLELDVPAISRLGLDNYVLFVSRTLPDFLRGVMGVPEWITNRLEQSRQVLWVENGGRNPITDLLQRVENEGVRNIVATAEANLPNGVTYSTRPLQENFGNGTVELLRRKGKSITIVPVTMSGNFRLREDFQGAETRTYDSPTLPVTIHEPIPAEVVDLLAATGSRGLLNFFIRQQWLDQMHRDSGGTRLVGMPPMASLQPALDRRIFEARACRGFWNTVGTLSPVGRLSTGT